MPVSVEETNRIKRGPTDWTKQAIIGIDRSLRDPQFLLKGRDEQSGYTFRFDDFPTESDIELLTAAYANAGWNVHVRIHHSEYGSSTIVSLTELSS